MPPMGEDSEALVSLADVAEMAGVSRPAVSNWRRRNADFPDPVSETGATSLFRLGEMRRWLSDHGKRFEIPSLDQIVWSALNLERGDVLPEEAARAGMTLLGYLALALQVDGDLVAGLRAAVADNDHLALEQDVLRRLDDQARRLGLTEVFPARIAGYWPQAGWPFLGKVVNLALEHGTGDVFEALIVAIGRGSRGTGEFATPRSISDLIISLAGPVQGVVVDPACGFGTLLVGASKAATAPLTLVGQDINDGACDIARLRMFAHGQPADIIHGDTLRTDLFEAPTRMDSVKADLVVADPPFGNRMLEWLQAGITRLGDSGLGIFVLPAGSMFWGGAEGEMRRRLIREHAICAVLALPSGLYPTIPIPVTIWVVRKALQKEDRRSERNSILLVDASQLGSRNRSRTELTSTDAAGIARCFHAWQEREELSAEGGVRAAITSTEAVLASGGDLIPASWIEDPGDAPEQRLERLLSAERELWAAGAVLCETSFSVPPFVTRRLSLAADNGAIKSVTDLATVIRPRRIDPEVIGSGATPLIQVQDLGADLSVTASGRVDLVLLTGRVEFTQPGDVVVAVYGAKLRAAVDHQGGAVVCAPLQVVRPGPDSMDPVVLAALITSLGTRHAVGAKAGHLDLTALQVPCPDLKTARWLGQALEALGEQRRAAVAAIKAIDTLGAELVDGLGSQAIRLDLQSLGGERQ